MNDPNTDLMRELYADHAGALWRYALRLTGDRGRAEDVVRETLLRAWQHPRVFEDSERSRAWLIRVACNVINDDRRGVRFRSKVNAPDGMDEFEQCGEDEVGAALDRLLIGDALTQLSPEQRAVIRRSSHLGWTTAQIAEDLHIAEDAVKSRMHDALHALRLTLQE